MFKIYSAINPGNEKIVSASERKKHLQCKFWKASKKEADIFFSLYFIHVFVGFPGNIVAILSGQLFKTNDLENTFREIKELETIYRQNLADERLSKAPKYKKIIETIITDENVSYPVLDSWKQLSYVTDNDIPYDRKSRLPLLARHS